MAQRSRLKELSERHSDLNTGKQRGARLMAIDPVLFMLAERAESAFGPLFIEEIAGDIGLTQCDMPTNQILEALTTGFFKDYLLPALQQKRHGSRVAERLSSLPPLTDASYVDYFVLFTTMFDGERTSDPDLYRATTGIQGILLGYQTTQAYHVCDGIVTFFNEMNDPLGLETLVRSISLMIKRRGKSV